MGGHEAGVRGFLAASPSPACTSAPPYLAHMLHDNVESLVQDHAQKTHQVLMLHLPGGRQRRVKALECLTPGFLTPIGDSRHDCCLIQEGLGGHIALDVLDGHLLAQVLAL